MQTNKLNMLLKITMIGYLLVISLLSATWAANKATPLPAEKAFVFSATVKSAHEIQASWKMANGYYLYRERMRANILPGTINAIQFPKGQARHSLERGQYEVYVGHLTVPIQFQTNAQEVTLEIDYQGCSKSGFCYPPVHKVVNLTLPGGTKTAITPTQMSYSMLLTNQNNIAALLYSTPLGMTLLLFVGIGLMLAFTPCVLPMVPILTGLIVGQQKSVSTKKAFLLSLTYVLGMAITYALVGVLAATLGNSLQVWLQKPIVITLTSLLFFLLALSMFGLYHLQLPPKISTRLSYWSNRQQGGTYSGVLIMGILSTLVVSPCVTAPLVGVLIYIAQTGDKLFGASVLFAMAIGMGIPLLLIGVSAGKWLPKRGPWMEVVKKIFGILMFCVGIWLLSRILPTIMVILLWLALLVGVIFFLGVYLPDVLGRRKFHRGLALVAGLLGVVLIGGEIGTLDVVRHWMGAGQVAPASSFVIVRNMTDLEKQLSLAKMANQPVMLDFYADWCESCVIMDRTVFNQAAVQQAITRFMRLRVDLSANNAEDALMMEKLNVIAPPTILFFNVNGQELDSKRIIGEVGSTELLNRINLFNADGCDHKQQC